jgi:hypothetical protein
MTWRSGEIEFMLPPAVDASRLHLNAQAAEFAVRTDLAAKRRTLLLSGIVSERAAQELCQAGCAVRTGLHPECSK